MTIDKAIEELNDRVELWEDHNAKGIATERTMRDYVEVLRMGRDALEARKKNTAYLDECLAALEQISADDTLTVECVREILEGFK